MAAETVKETPTRVKDSRPLDRPKNYKPIVVGGAAGGLGLSAGFLILRSINFTAWDDLLRHAVGVLLLQSGPLPVITVFVLVALGALYHNAMAGQVKAKDGEIQRLVEHRDRLEERLGLEHPSSTKPSSTGKR